MIKVVNLVSVIIAPIIVQYKTGLGVVGWLVVLVLLAGFVWAIWQSKRKAPELTALEPEKARVAVG
jgi:uncharacterized membrane protein